MRSIVHYRTTLGHKCNNAWGEARTAEFDTVRHPVLGPVACLLARTTILPGQEVTVNYNYALNTAPGWYIREHKAFRKTLEEIKVQGSGSGEPAGETEFE